MSQNFSGTVPVCWMRDVCLAVIRLRTAQRPLRLVVHGALDLQEVS